MILLESNSRKPFHFCYLPSNKRAKCLYPVIQVGRKIVYSIESRLDEWFLKLEFEAARKLFSVVVIAERREITIEN